MSNSGKLVTALSLAGVVIAAGAWLFPDIREQIRPSKPAPSATSVDKAQSGQQSGDQQQGGTSQQKGSTQKGGSTTQQSSRGPEWSCPGGTFCAWDGPDGTGTMIVQKDSACRLHDIGSAGLGDRVSSFQNRTGKTVGLYNWDGAKWDLLVRIPNGQAGNVPKAVDNATDAVEICIQ